MRVRPSMDMIANMIEKDPYKIKYPDRDASFYLNSPQFLSLLQDTNVGLLEQSKNLAQRQVVEARVVAEGRGGVVDRAVDTGTTTTDVGTNVYEGQMLPELLRKKTIKDWFYCCC